MMKLKKAMTYFALFAAFLGLYVLCEFVGTALNVSSDTWFVAYGLECAILTTGVTSHFDRKEA